MKINKENSGALRKVSNVKSKIDSIKSKLAQNINNNSKNITSYNVTSNINNIRKTFSIQEDLSKVQQKISYLKTFNDKKVVSLIRNATYNNKNLFSETEIKKISSNKNNLNVILKEYTEQEKKLNQQLAQQLVQHENTNAITVKNDIVKIKNYLSQAIGYNMKETKNVIIDLLK